jgi:hypothetical protein
MGRPPINGESSHLWEDIHYCRGAIIPNRATQTPFGNDCRVGFGVGEELSCCKCRSASTGVIRRVPHRGACTPQRGVRIGECTHPSGDSPHCSVYTPQLGFPRCPCMGRLPICWADSQSRGIPISGESPYGGCTLGTMWGYTPKLWYLFFTSTQPRSSRCLGTNHKVHVLKVGG